MPTYEYRCSACGHEMEAFQKITEAPLTECPKCHANSLTKLISATNFQLKGTGWYVTDIRDKNKPKPAATNDDSAKTTQSTDKPSDSSSSSSSGAKE